MLCSIAATSRTEKTRVLRKIRTAVSTKSPPSIGALKAKTRADRDEFYPERTSLLHISLRVLLSLRVAQVKLVTIMQHNTFCHLLLFSMNSLQVSVWYCVTTCSCRTCTVSVQYIESISLK